MAYDTPATLLGRMIVSGLVISYLLHERDGLTPDFFRFVTCLTDSQGSTVWAFLLWACYK